MSGKNVRMTPFKYLVVASDELLEEKTALESLITNEAKQRGLEARRVAADAPTPGAVLRIALLWKSILLLKHRSGMWTTTISVSACRPPQKK